MLQGPCRSCHKLFDYCKRINFSKILPYLVVNIISVFFQTLTECYERVCDTPKFNQTEPKPRKDATYKITLLCRSDTFLVIEIVDTHDKDVDDTYYGTYGNHSGNYKYSRNKQEKGNLYMVKVERGNLLSQKIFYIVSNWMWDRIGKSRKLVTQKSRVFLCHVMHTSYTCVWEVFITQRY